MINSSFDSISQTLTIALQSDLLSSNVERAAEAFEEQLGQIPSLEGFVLDLRVCKMIDSVGLNLLFSMLNRCQENGANVKVLISPGRMSRIMEVAQIGKLFKLETVS